MTYFDSAVNSYTVSHVTPSLVSLAENVSSIGDTSILIGLGILVAAMYLYRRRLKQAIIMLFSVGTTAIVVMVLKDLFMRPRPDTLGILTDYSFPSGHAALAAAFFLALLYNFWPSIRSRYARTILASIFILVVLIIGISRIVLNVHWFSDVLGGWSVGMLCASLTILAARRAIKTRPDAK